MTTEDFIKTLFASNTQQCVHLCSLGNERDGPHAPRFVSTRNMQEVGRFLAKWDGEGRGLFFCVGTLEQGARREKVNIKEIAFLHGDIDFKGIIDTRDDVVRKLQQLRMPPSIIVFSGNGLHAYWLLKEALGPDEFERIESALRLLADTIGGDLQVCEVSRLMRLPGSHNTKFGAWTPVEIQTFTEVRYELDDLEEWLSETSPVILRTKRPAAEPETNPFLAAAAAIGFKPPLDVEARLNGMMYMGGGDSSIHGTQLAVTASMLNQGIGIDQVVTSVLSATQAAAGQYGGRWNWRREENAIRKMCQTWLSKHPQQVAAPRPKQAAAGGSGNIVSLADAAKQVRPKKKDEAPASAVLAVADGTIKIVRDAGHDILLNEGEVWIYDAGIWHVMTPGERQWLLTLIQTGFTTLGEPPKNNNLTAAWKRLMEHPDLFKRTVDWNAGDMIVCQNGVLRFAAGQFEAHSPLHFARRKIGVAYDAQAACPMFVDLLNSMFSDRGAEQAGLVKMVQQWGGSALATRLLGREERKALLAVGPSRSGKTELSRIFRHILGEPIASPSVAEISERFGLQSLYGAGAWIRDDAINEGDTLDPQRFKTIVTGEPIDIERKHHPAMRCELSIPVMLTTNALPRARDKSDAIFNRCLILEMTNVVSEEDAVRMRREAGVVQGKTIGDHIVELEGPGILNWMITGLRALLKRGSYELPGAVQAATQRFKDDNNPVSEWARTALRKAPGGRVARHDLMCAYHGWQREQDGDDARAFGARGFFPRLRAFAPWIADFQDSAGKRFVLGIHLTDEGLQQWDDHHSGPQLRGGSTGISMTKLDVNRTHSDEVKAADEPRF